MVRSPGRVVSKLEYDWRQNLQRGRSAESIRIAPAEPNIAGCIADIRKSASLKLECHIDWNLPIQSFLRLFCGVSVTVR